MTPAQAIVFLILVTIEGIIMAVLLGGRNDPK